MRSRLMFGLAMAFDFDTYLIDEVTAVGDAAFRAKSRQLLETRLLIEPNVAALAAVRRQESSLPR